MSRRKLFRVPRDAPVVVHRHGAGARRRSIAVVVEETDCPDEEFEALLARWRLRIGGWVTKTDAAATLGVSTQRVDQLRRDGRLAGRLIGGVAAIDAASLCRELARRGEEAPEE